MKTQSMLGALFISAMMTAQTSETPVTVNVKKVQIINGVATTTDTTYTTTDPLSISSFSGLSKDGTVIVNKNGSANVTIINGAKDSLSQRINVSADKTLELLLQSTLKDLDGKKGNSGSDQMIVLNVSTEIKDDNGDVKPAHIFIVKKIKVITPSEEETKMLNKETGIADNKLSVKKMNFYPNPSNGKFTLSFSLAEKGNTELTVMNMEGKSIYSETLKDFSGEYSKEIDISSNPKGVYFVKIKQGNHAQVKKIVLE